MHTIKKERNSSIEALKVFAMLLVVICHVTQSVGSPQTSALGFPMDYVIDLQHVTYDISQIILVFFHHLGPLGNLIFFISSAWFLCESQKVNVKKICRLLTDVWVISIIVLLIFLAAGVKISWREIIKCLFPTIFSNNWYITAYILLYAIHTQLNVLVEKMTQRQMFGSVIMMFLLYCIFGMVSRSFFFGTNLTLFITLYFMMAYQKKYMKEAKNPQKFHAVMLLLGLSGIIILVLLTDFLGHHIAVLENLMLHWSRNCNPFLIMIAMALFNLARQKSFTSTSVNYISSLSLLIYVIHENLLIKTYCRTWIWHKIYSEFGYHYVVLWTILYSIVWFVLAIVLGICYKTTIQKKLEYLVDLLYKKLWLSLLISQKKVLNMGLWK